MAYLIGLGIGAKLLIDTTVQFFNPYLTVFADGIGLTAVALGAIVAARGLTGFSAPAIGALADRIGHKRVMQAGLFIGGTGMIAAGTTNSIIIFIAAVILTGFGQTAYTPNLHAYLSSKLPYSKRARGIGIVEYSWALAGIAGLSVSGYLIDAVSWRAPFIFLGALLLTAAAVYSTLPAEKIHIRKEKHASRGFLRQISSFIRLGDNSRSAWGTIAVQGLNMFAIMHIMIIHGGWLIEEYSVSATELGNIALIMGVADLSASVLVSLAVDRIGKRRSVAIGVAGMSAGFVLLPLLDIGLAPALAGLIIPRVFFEFATVSNIALMTEQAPKERGKMMSLGTTLGLSGITAASALGPVSYLKTGISGLASISLVAGIFSLVIILVFVKEKQHSP